MGLLLGSARSLVSVVLAGFLLAGCAAELRQGREDLLLRAGETRVVAKAAPHADLFLDYALLADQSYADSLYESGLSRQFDVGPDTYCLGRENPGDPCLDRAGLTAYAIARLKRWRLVYAEKDPAAFRCIDGRPDCVEPLPGLGVQVWMRRGRICPEAAIVFRGTDGQSADDWLSNVRWLVRLLPIYDQYDQVRDHTPGFVRRIEAQPCFSRGRTRIVAIGHSLGGGLAQNAAFRDGRVRHVSAIDPSFVTGREDLDPILVARNARGLGIDQLYERGEILAYPRFIVQQFDPPSPCDPLVRRIRLDTMQGNPLTQHSLASLTTGLLAWSKSQRDAGMTASEPLPGPTPTTCRIEVARTRTPPA